MNPSAAPAALPPRLRAIAGRPGVDLPAAERAVADLLRALGRDPTSGHLAATPRRVADSLREMLTCQPFDLTTFPTTRAPTSW
jgi:GTP cyclohydrolase I